MKILSAFWPLLVGLIFMNCQAGIFYVRFGHLPQISPLRDYLLFFIAGALGGLILMFFLGRSVSAAARLFVWISFLLAFPVALIASLFGGLLGWMGVIIYPLILWTFFSWFGWLMGRSASRG